MRDLKTTMTIAEAPRQVPMSVCLVARLGGLGQMGWFFVAMGMAFLVLVGTSADYSFWRYWGELETVTATVTEVNKTRVSEGGSRNSPGTPVYEHVYEFDAPGGAKFTGRSYRKGKGPRVGATVEVEHPTGDPSHSRIRGMRGGVIAVWIVPFLAIFPTTGICFVVHRWRKGARAIRLLRDGYPALGKLESKKATATRVNKKRVYKVTFSFEAIDGQTYECVARTNEPEVLEDDESEQLLYDPRDPSRAMMLDTLPGLPQLDEYGRIEAAGGRSFLVLILPTIAVTATFVSVVIRFGV